MASEKGKTRSKKGVVYATASNVMVDCLFCRIARGESPPNQLWYQDDRCSVFIPRGPAARLHLLVVPLEHIQTIATLTEEHRSLLEHMQKVAVEQLRTHSKYIGTAEFPLLPLARPPSHYAFNRGHLPALHPSPPATADHGETTPMDPSFVFCFHRPPYNSIDHLHLHAIQKPYRTWRSRFMFGENFRWHASIDSVFRNLPLAKAKL